MRKGTIKNLITRMEEQHGADKRAAWLAAAQEIDNVCRSGQVDPASFSIRGVFEETVGNASDYRSASPEYISEALHSSAFPIITNTIINNVLMPPYQVEVGPAMQLVSERDAVKTGSENVAGLTAEDGPTRRREAMAYEEDSFGQKFVTIDKSDFGRMISISRETIIDDRTGEVIDRARSIGRKAGQHQAIQIIQTVEVLPRTALGEATSRAFVYNGTALTQSQFYATTHATVADKLVNANTVTNALDSAGLKAALTLFGDMVDEDGDKVTVTPKILLVPYALQVDAWELTKSMLRADSAENAKNFWGPEGGLGLTPLASSHLSTSYYWYMGDFPAQLLWLWVWRPETATQGVGSDLAFSNQIVMRIRYAYNGGVGHLDYRHIVRGGNA